MRRRFFWSMVAVAALTIGLLVILAAVVSQRAQQNATERVLTDTTEAVAAEIEELIADLRPAEVGEAVQGPGFVRVLEQARRATDADVGLVIRTPRQTRLTVPWLEQLDFSEVPEVGGSARLESEAGVAIARSVAFDRIGGDVIVVAARRSQVIDWSDQIRILVAGVFLSAVIAGIAARWMSRWIVKRIQPLADGARALSEGELSARVPVAGEDEVSDVSRSFNEMADALEGSRERERQFLLSVGHDLRTPLTTIGGYAEALEDGVDDPAEVTRIAGVMTNENRRLRRLIEDVMLLARVESSEFGVRPESVDVSEHIKGVVAGYVDRAKDAHVELVVDAPATGARHVDPDRLAQIISNLVENALRFTPETGTIKVAVTPESDHVVMSVGDTGAGIDDVDLPNIFDRFYVAKKYRGIRPEGSGLGLSIVERLVTTMGGTVDAVSTVGEGTTFSVRLPAPPG